MRDMLIQDKQALLQSLAAAPAVAGDGWLGRIPTAGQMVLGFILPFALAFVAVPLESFIHSARTVGVALRVLANLVRQASRALVHAYDVLIVLPLLAEHLVRSRRTRAPEREARRVDPGETTLHPLS